MKTILAVAAILLSSASAFAAERPDKLIFKNQGFAIAALDEIQEPPCQSLMMFLPASGGFAPNVNVQIQAFGGTIAEYTDLSKRQFTEGDFTLIKETPSKTAITFEYKRAAKDRDLHFYSKAVKKGRKVYLTTATSTEEQWRRVSDKLRKCVDSFEAR